MTGVHWLLAHCPVLKVRNPAVDTAPALLHHPPGLRLRRRETKIRQDPGQPDLSIDDRASRQRNLWGVERDVAVAMNDIEPPLGCLARPGPVVHGDDLAS